MNSKTRQPNIEIVKFCEGFNFGDGMISSAKLRATAGVRLVKQTEAAINSNQIILPIDNDKNGNQIKDDGCGDGRAVRKIFSGNKLKTISLSRPKVFGGGAVMLGSILLGNGKVEGKLSDYFVSAIDYLEKFGIEYGAHTADKVIDPENNCGCAAIDKAPEIIEAACRYETEIYATLKLLNLNTSHYLNVVKAFQFVNRHSDAATYHGRFIIDRIRNKQKIIKELSGAHHEAYIIINFVKGYTVNQNIIRSASNDLLQAFAIDFWRLEYYARQSENIYTSYLRALTSELLYTLATSAVLTAGDLPVYLVRQKPFLA